MKIDVSKTWCANMARREAGAEISAGILAIDPVFDPESSADPSGDETRVAFQRFVCLGRRSKNLTIDALAEEADIKLSELMNIEADVHFKPELRTLYKLAEVFDVSQRKLMELSGLSQPKDAHFPQEAVRYAAQSKSIEKLTAEERAALDGLISVLSEK